MYVYEGTLFLILLIAYLVSKVSFNKIPDICKLKHLVCAVLVGKVHIKVVYVLYQPELHIPDVSIYKYQVLVLTQIIQARSELHFKLKNNNT